MKKLENKVAIITGSGKGLGKATALLFAREGAKVVINYSKSETEANAVVSQIKKLGSDAIAIKCDVSIEDQVKQMVEKTVKKFGKIDILVNNSGIIFDVPFEMSTVDKWKRTLEVNLIGTFLCSKYVAPYMKKQKYGKIVNVCTSNGVDSYAPEPMDYDASKAGINIFTRALARELAPTIYVNGVAPGWIDTDLNKNLPKDLVVEEMKKIYLKRWAKPEEIAKAILFLASDDASYVTGTILKVDGGL